MWGGVYYICIIIKLQILQYGGNKYLMELYTITNENLLKEDYGTATLNIIWHRYDNERTVVFGLIELLPKEFPKPLEISETCIKVNKKGYQKQAFYHEKIVCSINKAIEWYNNIRNNKNIDFINDHNKVFKNYHYLEDVKFPQLLISNKLPFVFGYDQSVRFNTLYNCSFPSEIYNLLRENKYKNFINNNINFDIFKFPEYIGTINIVAYNPLIRDIRVCLRGEGSNEKVIVEIEPRENVNIEGLKYIHIEKRLKGYSSYKEIEIKDKFFSIATNNNVEQIAHVVVCPKRGVIDWSEFCAFMKSIHFSMNIVSGEKCINVPSKNLKNNKEYQYKTDIIGNTVESIVEKDKDSQSELRNYLLRCNKIQNIHKEEISITQRLFYDNPSEAITFIRDLVSNAHNRVIIIDPYFRIKELFDFAYAVKNSQIPINIITSFANENLQNSLKFAKNLRNNINKNKVANKINAYIMLGDKPAFHDRFIIVDDNVWLSGNSLADIGKRASILVQLQYPNQIINMYKQIIEDKNKCLSLEEWLNGKKTS